MVMFYESKLIIRNHQKESFIRVIGCLSQRGNLNRRLFSTINRSRSSVSISSSSLSSLDLVRKNDIFSSNIYLTRNISKTTTISKGIDSSIDGIRSEGAQDEIFNSASTTSTSTSTSTSTAPTTSDTSINPPSSVPFEIKHLDHSSPRKAKSTSETPFYAPYLALTKPRLSALVILSAMSSYALTPYDATLSQLLFLTIGTALSSGSANAINMAREYEYDAQMTRTRTRPVVRGLVTPNQAFSFAGLSGTIGVAALYFGVNPTVAALGAANIVLYGWTYTSLKRTSIINTWVGAIVGAIPPLMGWAASSSLTDPGAWALAGLLYAWQFPHFNSLSHNIRDEYRRAGYIMAAWTNPSLNARVALRYSIAMFPLCIALSYFNVTDWFYSIDSGLLNGWLTYLAYKFWLEQRNVIGPILESSSGGGSSFYARKLFWGSVLHLPGVLVLAMIHKKGQWDWIWREGEEEEEEEEYED